MKQYKHKKLWWIVEDILNWYKRVTESKTYYYEKELIEDSQDRELLEERDWIDDAIENFEIETDYRFGLGRRQQLILHIRKLLPKITEEELDTLYSHKIGIWWMEFVSRENLKNLLKSKWLLAE